MAASWRVHGPSPFTLLNQDIRQTDEAITAEPFPVAIALDPLRRAWPVPAADKLAANEIDSRQNNRLNVSRLTRSPDGMSLPVPSGIYAIYGTPQRIVMGGLQSLTSQVPTFFSGCKLPGQYRGIPSPAPEGFNYDL